MRASSFSLSLGGVSRVCVEGVLVRLQAAVLGEVAGLEGLGDVEGELRAREGRGGQRHGDGGETHTGKIVGSE